MLVAVAAVAGVGHLDAQLAAHQCGVELELGDRAASKAAALRRGQAVPLAEVLLRELLELGIHEAKRSHGGGQVAIAWVVFTSRFVALLGRAPRGSVVTRRESRRPRGALP